jgi:hypothetical protein
VGLFRYILDGTLSNIGLLDMNVTGSYEIGGLVGVNYIGSVVNNSYATGNVTGYSNVGGLVGVNFKPSVSNSYSTSSVTGIK